MNKAEKQQYIENLDQMSKDYSAVFVASFSKMSVKEMIEFRTEIKQIEFDCLTFHIDFSH